MSVPVRVNVRVTPRAKRPGVETAPDGTLLVKVTAPAEDGRANAALVDMLADHFGVPKGSVRIIRGQASRHKLVQINK